MPMVRPNPLQVSQAPTGELKENRLGIGSRYDRSQSGQWSALEYFQQSRLRGGSLSSTTCTLTRPWPTRSAASMDSSTRPRSALPRRKRSCTTWRIFGGESSFLALARFCALLGAAFFLRELGALGAAFEDFESVDDFDSAPVASTAVSSNGLPLGSKNRVYPCFSSRSRTSASLKLFGTGTGKHNSNRGSLAACARVCISA